MAHNISGSRLAHLAATIRESVGKIEAVLSAQGLPSPSFDEDASPRLPKEASHAQDATLDAAAELYDLLLDPLTLIFKHSGVRRAKSRDFD